MDSFHIRDVKAEKTNAILRYRRLQKIATLFRFLEICAFLIMISRFSAQIPVRFKAFGDYFRDLFTNPLSPRLVFVVGNAIVITLFVKSGQCSSPDSNGNGTGAGFVEKFMESYDKVPKIGKNQLNHVKKQSTKPRSPAESKNYYTRTRSENLMLVNCKKFQHELRRSETEKFQKNSNFGAKQLDRSYSEDKMSNEEFRRTVEAFIARQQRLLREEESLPLLP